MDHVPACLAANAGTPFQSCINLAFPMRDVSHAAGEVLSTPVDRLETSMGKIGREGPGSGRNSPKTRCPVPQAKRTAPHHPIARGPQITFFAGDKAQSTE
eukprot:CAMPEP_0179445174 /NCGR_PEP_ID=MMETSP0799-20121207/28626_1 /TAXON_ID=46947 /ORGANISM="Geminigera cryophila, Strain CCMP2564" /LENGTH=99 /DNA_ID=CAMNT_0021232965 /DNA_START=647 /DNA_END=946 /DNA_ORIENTATION=+